MASAETASDANNDLNDVGLLLTFQHCIKHDSARLVVCSELSKAKLTQKSMFGLLAAKLGKSCIAERHRSQQGS